ncbi:M23 family metallopeptidase [Nocardioides sp. zg-536]|uniref:M23 family metallopeptidase n=1 Tax=Nocardioides faecalis TaxID=2803858 RepID=A0A939BT87_9ACTN|nr:M23 family metallopeptidase [Nocardioides faecalis]MBM9460404.1 M23 family metallopeptidase [Nocardioides faecalis]QVI59771.1 M23 family metallopeptidase [Nocardioides faecalis]
MARRLLLPLRTALVLSVLLAVPSAPGAPALGASGRTTGGTASTTARAAVSGDDPVGVWPLQPQPRVHRRFDPPDGPYGAGHRGVDLAGHAGQQVRTALPGRVAFVGRIAGRGVVTVSHGDTRTTYEPVAGAVAVGQEVAAGAVIGSLELVGSHCFPQACLHWGWLRGETYLDPLRLVGGGPVRLLPLWRDRPAPAGVPGAPGVSWPRLVGLLGAGGSDGAGQARG